MVARLMLIEASIPCSWH